MDVLAYILYNLILIIASPVIGGYFLLRFWRRRLPWSGMSERLGFLPVLPPPDPGGRLWLHAVSVGEVGVAAALIPALHEVNPNLQVIISTVTETGWESAKKIEGIEHVFYLPIDYRFAVRSALERNQPTAIAMVETELWPNLIRQAFLRGVPVAVVNGRMGEKSFRGYRRLQILFTPVMKMVSGIAARGMSDLRRFRMLGASNVVIAGNIKFDALPPQLEATRNDQMKKYGLGEAEPIIVAGSTHPSEEYSIGCAFQAVRDRFPDAGLLVAPRHLNRLANAEAELRKSGLIPVRWSELNREVGPTLSENRVVILDKMGLLGEAYAFASAAFVGGSLIPHGGQNLIEAARWGIPVVFGPYVKNFEEEANELIRVGGGMQVAGADELSRVLISWLTDSKVRDRAGASAREVVVANRGAAMRTANFLAGILDSKAGISR